MVNVWTKSSKSCFSKFIEMAQGTNDVKVAYLQTLVVCQFCHSQEKHDSIMTKTNKSEEFEELNPKSISVLIFFLLNTALSKFF